MRPSSKRQKLLQAQQQSKQYLNDTKNLKESQGQFENKQMRNNQSQQQIDQEQNQSQYDNNTEIGNESEYGQKQTIFTMVNSMRQQLEKEFIDKFNEVRLLDKNKEIKFFQCVGDKVISKESTEEIEKERVEYKNEELREIQQQGVERYELLLNQDTPIIEQVVPSFDCQWDYDKNDPMKRRFLIQKKLTKVGTLIILKHRKEERLQKIKNFLNGAATKEEVKQLVNQDHQKAEYAGIGKKDFTAFSFEFEEHNIDKFLLPVQYESSNNFSNFKFEVNPRTGFDDWTAIEPIDYCDYEIMDYRNKDMPQIVLNPPIESQRKLRTGAEEEYGHLTKTGQFGDITEEKYIAEPIPKSFAKPFEIQAHQLLLPHSTIRRYEQYYEVTEVDPEYYLQHDPIQTQDEFDPNPLEEDPTVLKYDFLRKTPGLNSIQCLNSLPIEYQYYYNKRQDLPKDYGYESEMEKYCPGILPNIDYDDILTDDDSDGDAPPNIEK
ncbi:hypothetical protein PPERSA_10648 [Pseudocohnilembus persalinus]|uniref:Uncharacterized protein n=1 Tax=Pseudocohnilembus persalinus TaxID=266149 RepID=A0A0V0QDI0_PSEPJ|nr:hypothetical protein PPERSA_10648 [Pseudocohnilembus persalinus]|eukprot:KRX00149.1 hypothetical protein PPERSA_10648 [Pseudocohnilembus persalinus]